MLAITEKINVKNSFVCQPPFLCLYRGGNTAIILSNYLICKVNIFTIIYSNTLNLKILLSYCYHEKLYRFLTVKKGFQGKP